MKKIFQISVIVFSVVWFLASAQASSAAGRCMCYSDFSSIDAATLFKSQANILSAQCFESTEADCTIDKQPYAKKKDAIKPTCSFQASDDACNTAAEKMDADSETKIEEGQKASASGSGNSGASTGGAGVLATLISKCGEDKLPSECKDITVFVSLLIQIVNYLFSIIGALALGVFVYGGFQLILSQGNPEKVKQGTGALINAVIGLLIAFGGYVLISFLGQLIGLKSASLL